MVCTSSYRFMYSGRLQLLNLSWSHFLLNKVFLSSRVRLQPDSRFLSFIKNSGSLLAFVRMSENVLFLFRGSIIILFGIYYSIVATEGATLTAGGVGATAGATTVDVFCCAFSFCRADYFGSILSLLSLRLTDSLGLLRFILCPLGRPEISKESSSESTRFDLRFFESII